MEQATGVISWWDERVERGVIRTREDKRFYVYRSNIVSGVPTKGARVAFEWDPSKTVREGFLPKAYRILIQEQTRVMNYTVGAKILASPLPSSEVSDE